MKVARLNWRTNHQPPLPEVRSQSAPCDLRLLFIDPAGTHFNGQDGLHFHNREMRDYRERAGLHNDPVHILGARFLVI
jgi:hypothetical protein